jgi:hypothetical protein
VEGNMDGFDKAVDLASSLAPIFLAVFYLSTVLWTYKDARRRIEDPILVVTAVAAAIVLPIVGVFLYMMLRPPEYLDDVRERELEIRAMERTLGSQERCPNCRTFVESDFRACPICATKLRDLCRECAKPLDPRWAVCPYCETDVPKAKPFDLERATAAASMNAPRSAPARTESKPAPTRSSRKAPAASTGSPRAAAETSRPKTADKPKATKPSDADIVAEPMEPPARPASKKTKGNTDSGTTTEMATVTTGKKSTER